MITKETCVKIWNTHNEIEKCHKLIADMSEIVKKDKEKGTVHLSDAFGNKRGLQLGVPSRDNSHRIFDVNMDLSLKIIETHIKEQELRLVELMTIAKLELQ